MLKLQAILRRILRFSIPNLMTYLIGGQALLFVLGYAGLPVHALFSLTRDGLFRGEIWRLITFVFVPESANLFNLIFSLYLYWLIGNALESRWGSNRFTAYYLFGMAGAILACLITGYGVNTYLNLSLFLAFAALFPDFQLMLFFVIPLKIKYIALLDAALLLYSLIMNPWYAKAAILLSLMNLFFFLGGDLINTLRAESHYWKTRRNFRKAMWKR